ncbi:MAG TPA: hypothetical protein VLL76_00170, partial [Candidatus Omnitrophota bacterium]|nr:hypothetical protein [Candidatus Omnitrophota bacterium]
HSSAPHLAQNTLVAKDLLTQMMSMPAIDLGTAKTMADIHQKGTGHVNPGGAFGIDVPYIAGAEKNIALGKALQGKVEDDKPRPDKVGTVLNWNTPAMKTAGITSMFTGSGTPAQQADNATNFQMEQAGMPILPLDAIVRELMAKEQELAVRQDTIAQQEAELQQAMMAMQGVQGAYQQQYGAPPEGGMGGDQGDPAGMDQGGDQGGQGGEDPMAGGQDGGDPTAGDPAAASGDQGGQDPMAGDPAAAQPPPPPATIGSTPGPSGSGSDAAAMLGMTPGQPAAPAPAPAPAPEQGGTGDEAGKEDKAEGEDAGQAPEGDGQVPPAGEAGIEDGATGGQDLVGGAPPASTEGFPPSAGQPEATTIPAGAPVTDGNALTVTVPLPSLQISVKLAEQAAEDRMDAARALFSKTMTDIFRP